MLKGAAAYLGNLLIKMGEKKSKEEGALRVIAHRQKTEGNKTWRGKAQKQGEAQRIATPSYKAQGEESSDQRSKGKQESTEFERKIAGTKKQKAGHAEGGCYEGSAEIGVGLIAPKR